jgi:hypothetical protein
MTLLWDVRSALEEGEARMIEGIIAKNKNKKSYYIFKHSNWTGNGMETLKSTYMLRSTKPPKLLGTILWLVDNEKGSLTKIWELPHDVSVDSSFLDIHSPQAHIAKSAEDIAGAVVLS